MWVIFNLSSIEINFKEEMNMNFMRSQVFTSVARESSIAEHSVLRNTYLLLSLTILFSAITAWLAIATQAAPMGVLFSLVGMFGFLFLTTYLRNSAWGLVSVFGFTGFIGYMLGPIVGILNYMLHVVMPW